MSTAKANTGGKATASKQGSKAVANAYLKAAAQPTGTRPKASKASKTPKATGRTPKTTQPPKQSRAARIWRRIYRAVLMVLTFVSALGLGIASFGGHGHPSVYPGACVMVMLFPGWLLAMIVMTVLDAIWCRKALVICALAYAGCIHAILDFTPVNVGTANVAEGTPTFTLLSFNVQNFSSRSGEYPNGSNPAISYILDVDADVVCLQEAVPLAYGKWGRVEFESTQIDSLYQRYPYIIINSDQMMFLSKYPTEAIHTGSASRYNRIALARINVEGKLITLVNVHLQSYLLTKDDKQLYRDITSRDNDSIGVREGMGMVRTQLLSKIQRAAERRAGDAERMLNYISHFGGPNVIVTGDFNDVPGCYTLHRLADANMRQVYPEVCFGPAITYYVDKFYFRIDHVLYRGCLKPLDMHIGGSHASDHLPILTTFALTE